MTQRTLGRLGRTGPGDGETGAGRSALGLDFGTVMVEGRNSRVRHLRIDGALPDPRHVEGDDGQERSSGIHLVAGSEDAVIEDIGVRGRRFGMREVSFPRVHTRSFG